MNGWNVQVVCASKGYYNLDKKKIIDDISAKYLYNSTDRIIS